MVQLLINEIELKASIILERLGLICYICRKQLQIKGSIYESPMRNSEMDDIMLMKKRHICEKCNETIENFMDKLREKNK